MGRLLIFWRLGSGIDDADHFYGDRLHLRSDRCGVFHNSKKTESGTLESRTGWKGLCRKCMTLLFVLVAYRLDLAIGVDYIRDAVIIGFIANELISIVENAGLMGIPLPAVIANAIDILTQKAEKKGDA